MTLDISALFLNGVGLTVLGYLAHRALAGLDSKIQGQDKKLDQIIAGQVNFVTRPEHNETVCRLHDKVDHLEAEHSDSRNRLCVLESKVFSSMRSEQK